MRFIWDRTIKTKRLHIAKYSLTGEMLMKSICGSKRNFNTSLGAPGTFGMPVCKHCLKEIKEKK